MTHNTKTTVINVAVLKRDGQFFASSDDLFGLNISASSEEQLCERLKVGVKWLYKQNNGLDVEVHIPTDPAAFPRAPDHIPPQLIISAAA